MEPLDLFWHLLDFVAPALGMGLIAPTLAKRVWRRELRGVSWRWLAGWSAGLGALVLAAGLAAFGRDGRMATYGLLVLTTGGLLWWKSLKPSR